MNEPRQCAHAKTWTEECDLCDASWENDSLRNIADRARRAAVFYEQKPGLIQPATVTDLYNAVARLARLLERDAPEPIPLVRDAA